MHRSAERVDSFGAFYFSPLDLAGYCQLRHVIVSNEGGFRGFMDALIEAQGYRRDVAVSVSRV